ncbi:NAD(P)H-dependent oxidoreductase [Enterococcus alishanensis]|uniref:NAD(P)H-dependent oxidoreductase n=1 Tax=Enterococcus alishanensis TaxID=1303817 RepID=A0ABS6THZ4_9ENTE|nr:NAD(P)H-dependent oxidoreductase [Enterococcus alishanensis]MBV7392528.1 NAD(P)H-dependent oxidoreductase [Enterococcus alishanensis]
MKTTLIIDHPWDKSFNHALKNNLVNQLKENHVDYHLVDLYKDGFNPILETKDLATYQAGLSSDPIVNKYINILRDTNKLIIIFPIWWYSCPAGFKGFMDKVFLDGVAFHDDGSGLKPLLNIKSAHIFTTSEQPTDSLRERCENSFEGQIITTLKDIGIENVYWDNLGTISTLTDSERQNFITSASKIIRTCNE